MPTVIVATNIAGNVKPSFASSAIAGLTVRANGEEVVSVLDMNGNMVDASFPIGVAPTVTNNATASVLPVGKWAAWAYVYAATSRYPFVENDVSIGGSLAPRGNPSPATAQVIDGSGHGKHIVAPGIVRTDVDQIWFFRTAFFNTQIEAQTSADAGNLFFIGATTHTGVGSVAFDDNNSTEGGDLVEVDNFAVPTFQFVVYRDPYWWGWGNYPLSATASWTTGGVVTLTDGTKWFSGRNNQYVRLGDLTTQGIGNLGLWKFKFLTNTTAQLVLDDGTTNATLALAGAGTVVVQGPPTTLYRSKARNPFSWGFTTVLANEDRIPETYAFKIGGGLGTAIAVIPNLPYLQISTEYPAGTFTLDLRQAGNTGFENTLRQISNFYSITSHFSQFAATREDDSVVLWGWDAKNFCILACDGFAIQPISQAVSKTLRHMTQTRSRQILAHGAYDARNRLNCLWLPTSNADAQVNLLVCQHAPTAQWFIHDEHDVLCSAQFQDGDTNLSKIFIGTETGFMGEAFAEGFYANWISSDRSSGSIGSATATTLTRNDDIEFFLDRDGYVGNWCLVTDANGENEQWGRISAVSSDTLAFDYIRPAIGGITSAFNPPLVAGCLFYVGIIECRAVKYFDQAQPAEDKKLTELWFDIDGTDATLLAGHEGSTFLRYYRDRGITPYAPKINTRLNIPLKQVHFDDLILAQKWFTSTPPTERIKTFGVEIVDRGFQQWRLYAITMKTG